MASSTVDVIGQLDEKAARPEQVEVKFELKFSAQGNVVLAGASGEATLEVTLRYNPGPPVEVDRRVPGFLGRVLDAADEPAGTCFQVVPGVLVTAWHVLDDLGAGDVDAVVRVDPLHDLAVLVVGEPLVECVPGLAAHQ